MTTELAPITSLRKRDISDLQWRRKDGGLTRVGDMTDDHLRNTALMLMGMGFQRYRAPNELRVRWLTALRMEWEKRHPQP